MNFKIKLLEMPNDSQVHLVNIIEQDYECSIYSVTFETEISVH